YSLKEAYQYMESKVVKGTVKNSVEPDHIIKGEYKLKPNIKYTSNGYSYSTDDIGRIDNAQGKLQLGQGKRNSTHQVKVGGEDRNKGDHGGHLIAHIFGGSGLVDNMVPMNGKLVNQSSYRKLEIEWKTALKAEQEVYVNIKPKYKGNSLRPTEFIVNYTIDGKNIRRRLGNP
ncbi:type VII secretion protein, partial [Bacillus cereus]